MREGFLTIWDGEDDPPPNPAFDKGLALQKTAQEAYKNGFLLIAQSRALTFPELMMGQGWQIGQLVASLVSFAKDREQAVEVAESILKCALETVPDYIDRERCLRVEADINTGSEGAA